MEIKRAIASNIGTNSLGRILTGLKPLILVPFMIHQWGLELYGEWLILTAIPTYIMLSPDFGLAGAVVNRMPYLMSQGKEKEAICIYRSSFTVLLVTSVVFVGVGIVASRWINWDWFKVTDLQSGISADIIIWFCVQILIAQQGFLLSGIYRCARRNPRYGLLQSIGQAFYLTVGLMVLWLNGNPLEYAVALAFAYALFFIVIFVDSRIIMPNFTLSIQGVSLKYVKPYMVPGLGHAGMPLVHALQNEGVLVVLGMILGPTNVGIFQTARTLSNGVKSLVGMLSSAIMIELPALLGEGRITTVESLLVRNTQVGVLLTFVLIFVVSLSGNFVYHLWLGPQVSYHPMLVLLLFVSLLPFVIGQSFLILLQASNQIHLAILPLIAIAISSICCVGLGGRLAGISGSGLGIIVWEIGIATVAAVIVSRRKMKLMTFFTHCFQMKLMLKDLAELRGWIYGSEIIKKILKL